MALGGCALKRRACVQAETQRNHPAGVRPVAKTVTVAVAVREPG